ncbi:MULTISPECIES: ABC transporter family substrate-binding protein [unclassified Arthrobacter]|jgi:peptide/nickel transport system substrate-binding protein|uniref:ABC transporter family substrate-binding protein n=1 Tax=unclassified Arthrobacter TaxID=235627 RepID=UPI000381DF59|nr:MULTISPECIES: ABC transporter family substrate-binding protein [unclassified Arthrobacter]BCW56519.1 peptide ABC transporter substrate-binding protein [Arthrobacter sp. StoSoilB19]BCW77624.1 peptide ABC transporter substrate-binding protein [Arthrobacter sp. NicSoilB11]
MRKLNRIGGAAAVAAALALTACGGGGASGPETAKAQASGSDLAKLISINEKPAADLQQGGKVTLPLGNIGPDFNGFSNNGNSADNSALQVPMNPVAMNGGGMGGCWKVDFKGKVTPNTDFCESVDSVVKDGKQTITIKVNPKATYNDGTPIDVKAFKNTWNILKSPDAGYDIVSSGAYEFVDSVEAGSNDKEVIVKTSQPVFPVDSLFFGLIHPAVNTPEIFNEGFNGNLHPEWMAGPFKLDQYDTAAKTVTMVPNDKWWGQKPVLANVTFRQLETSAQIAAFKNGEIDAMSANTISLYKQLDGTKDSDIRRGQRLFAGGLNLNAQRITDVNVRKAIFAAVDREALRKVRFNGLNWEEPSSGSMMLLPFSDYYQDNYPVKETGADAAKKVLTDAGYTANANGIMEKDGKPAAFKISNFGDDPTTLAVAQTLQKQLQAGGMDVGIDQRASADFGKVLGSREFDLSISGYTVGPDATDAVKQYYDSKTNENKLGDAELDKKIADLASIEDNAARNKAAMDVEKEHMAKYYSMGVVFNGPQISFVRTGLANYGPSLFKSLSQVPDWTTIGWEKK